MIYFIEDSANKRIKVGYSVKPLQRLKDLQTGSSTKLVLLGDIEGSLQVETLLHKRFSPHRIQGEWFTEEIKPECQTLISLADYREYLLGILTPIPIPEDPRILFFRDVSNYIETQLKNLIYYSKLQEFGAVDELALKINKIRSELKHILKKMQSIDEIKESIQPTDWLGELRHKHRRTLKINQFPEDGHVRSVECWALST